MAIVFKHKGDLRKTRKFLQSMKQHPYLNALDKYGMLGVRALSEATPKDTGVTAGSWGYRVEKNHDGVRIVWTNTNRNDGVCIALLLQYGHGTKNGGYVEGVDYINPAMRPIFEKLAAEAWSEVTKQ